ncbi:hypothetical protein [Sorangium sp. So ce381]|uniref:hypothetical protein n=1 Tax=Sorangium sp. So ce381 TaxID=3133307 RepID=UPI003F5B539B
MKTRYTSIDSMLRRIARIASPLLLCALPLACVAGDESELLEDELLGEATQALGGWYTWARGTTTDLTGASIGGFIPSACFLSGVAGNLGEGVLVAPGVLSTARVDEVGFNTWNIWAHGGATVNSSGVRVFKNNPVLAATTCFSGTVVAGGVWESKRFLPLATPSAPVKIADIDPNHLRQCFLSGVSGSEQTWANPDGFARVHEVTATNSSHPTAGWYVESNLFHFGSHFVQEGSVKVEAGCIDFPANTGFVQDEDESFEGFTTHRDTDFLRTGIRACALTEIGGMFHSNDWDDGVMLEPPTTSLSGTWKVKLTNGKRAKWVCVK